MVRCADLLDPPGFAFDYGKIFAVGWPVAPEEIALHLTSCGRPAGSIWCAQLIRCWSDLAGAFVGFDAPRFIGELLEVLRGVLVVGQDQSA